MPGGSTGAALDSSGAKFVRRLSSEDLSILALEDDLVAGHTCKVILLGEQVDPERLRTSIAARVDRAPELRMRLSEVDGQLSWVLDPAVDVRAHVAVCQVSGPPDEAGLRNVVANVFRQRLDRSRPLWQIDVIPKLESAGSALIWRLHHALADGSTAMRVASASLWDPELEPDVHARGPRAPRRAPQRDHAPQHHRLGGVRAAAREIPQLWLRSPFNGHITERRSVAFTSVPLGGLRRVAAATDGATVNDAVLTAVAGGLRKWLEASHGHFGAVRVKVPVSLHGVADPGADGRDPGNRDYFFCLDLPLGSGDPITRLAAVRRATRIRKEGHDAQYLDALMRQLGHVPQLRHFAERVLAHPRSFALNVSNVPGPVQPVSVRGAPVQALYSLAEIRQHHGLRIAVTSLGGRLNFGLLSDPTLVPDVELLAGYIEAEADALAAGISTS